MPRDADRDRLRSEVRRTLEARRDALQSELKELARRRGKVLFDGEWLSPKEVKRQHWRLRIGSLRMTLEILFFCVALVAAAGVLWVLLVLMGGWTG